MQRRRSEDMLTVRAMAQQLYDEAKTQAPGIMEFAKAF